MSNTYKGYELNDYSEIPWYAREIALFKQVIDAIEAVTLPVRDPYLVLFGDFAQSNLFHYKSNNLAIGSTADPDAKLVITNATGGAGEYLKIVGQTDDNVYLPDITLVGGIATDYDASIGLIALDVPGQGLKFRPGYHTDNAPYYVSMQQNSGADATHATWNLMDPLDNLLTCVDSNGRVGIKMIPDNRQDSTYLESVFEMSGLGDNQHGLISYGSIAAWTKNLYLTDDPDPQTFKLKTSSAASSLSMVLDTLIYDAQNIGGTADSTAELIRVFFASPTVGFWLNSAQASTSGAFTISGNTTAEAINYHYNNELLTIKSQTNFVGDTTEAFGPRICNLDSTGYSALWFGDSTTSVARGIINYNMDSTLPNRLVINNDNYMIQLKCSDAESGCVNVETGGMSKLNIGPTVTSIEYNEIQLPDVQDVNDGTAVLLALNTTNNRVGTITLDPVIEGHSFDFIVYDRDSSKFALYSAA